jgi:hypothetical protein
MILKIRIKKQRTLITSTEIQKRTIQYGNNYSCMQFITDYPQKQKGDEV